MSFPTDGHVRCPHCGCQLASVPLYRSATTFVNRKCRSRRCGTRWVVKLVPIKFDPRGMLITEATFSQHPEV